MERTFPIIDVAPTGAGIGYPDGIRTFVPGALPGDVVACDWTPPEKGRQSQVIDHFEFVERAAKRAPEPCPHLCGTPACSSTHEVVSLLPQTPMTCDEFTTRTP